MSDKEARQDHDKGFQKREEVIQEELKEVIDRTWALGRKLWRPKIRVEDLGQINLLPSFSSRVLLTLESPHVLLRFECPRFVCAPFRVTAFPLVDLFLVGFCVLCIYQLILAISVICYLPLLASYILFCLFTTIISATSMIIKVQTGLASKQSNQSNSQSKSKFQSEFPNSNPISSKPPRQKKIYVEREGFK